MSPLAFVVPVFGLVALAPGTAVSMDYQPYASLYGGVSFLDESDSDNAGVDLETQFDTGFVAGGTFGAVIREVFTVRVELDLNYRRHEIDKVGGTPNADGTVNTFGLLTNYWLDIVNSSPITPYLGGGIGLAYINAVDWAQAGADIVDDEDVVFAWQIGAGVGWDINPSVTVSLDYRLFSTDDPEFENTTGGDFQSEYTSNNFLASVRYNF